MASVTIYAITCTRGIYAGETGTRYSLTPWGNDTDRIQGYDDGGKEYILPEGYTVGYLAGGLSAIFCGKQYCEVVSMYGRPALVGAEMIRLRAVRQVA